MFLYRDEMSFAFTQAESVFSLSSFNGTPLSASRGLSLSIPNLAGFTERVLLGSQAYGGRLHVFLWSLSFEFEIFLDSFLTMKMSISSPLFLMLVFCFAATCSQKLLPDSS